MRLRSLLLSFALFVALIAAQDARATTISLAGFANVQAYAFNGAGNFATANSEQLTSVPASETLIAVDGASRSEVTYSFTDTGLILNFDHYMATPLGSSTATFVRIHFSPSTRVDYVFSGAYSTDAVDGIQTALDVRITQTTGSQPTLFHSRQESIATPAESFVLGESGGDNNNILIGSPTGTLLRNRTYDLDIGIDIWARYAPTTSITHATGSVTLTFVPEPSSGPLPVPFLATTPRVVLALTVLLVGSALIAYKGSREGRV